MWALSGSSFHIFLFRQFFSAIPKDLEDAAEVDGCSRFIQGLTSGAVKL
jgi:multiple sugar transport system permease protein